MLCTTCGFHCINIFNGYSGKVAVDFMKQYKSANMFLCLHFYNKHYLASFPLSILCLFLCFCVSICQNINRCILEILNGLWMRLKETGKTQLILETQKGSQNPTTPMLSGGAA